MLSYWSRTVISQEYLEIGQTPQVSKLIHVTNIALGRNAADGPHTVLLSVRGVETVIATLQKDGCCFQHHLDIILDSDTLILNTGKSAVHLAGYTTTAYISPVKDIPEASNPKVCYVLPRLSPPGFSWLWTRDDKHLN